MTIPMKHLYNLFIFDFGEETKHPVTLSAITLNLVPSGSYLSYTYIIFGRPPRAVVFGTQVNINLSATKIGDCSRVFLYFVVVLASIPN